MANKRLYVYGSLVAIACLGTLLVVLILWHREDDQGMRQDEQLITQLASLSQRKNVTVRAKLLTNDSLHQKETAYCDMSEHATLIISLLSPPEWASPRNSTYPSVCRIEIVPRGETSIVLEGIWMGKGNAIFVTPMGRGVLRQTDCFPVKGEEYIDEALTLCGLIRAVQEKHKQDISHYSSLLRQSITGRH
jgi:hypothetical protein